MKHRPPVTVALLSASLLSLELIWTRLYSAEFFYTFAFLILSLAILGLGLGALALRLAPRLASERALGPVLALAGLAALVGPPVVFSLGLDFAKLLTGPLMVIKLLLAIALLGSSFFFGGMALASVFRRNHQAMPRLYMADLLGAGGGVLMAMALMNAFGTPAATFLSSIPILVAAILATGKAGKIAAVPLTLLAFAISPVADRLVEAPRKEHGPIAYKHWDAMAKIKVYDYGPEYRSINIDNIANTGVFGFDGDWNKKAKEPFEFGIDVGNLIKRFPNCTFLSLGAGGGGDVVQALQYGATEVHAVEVNPHINRLMLVDDPRGWVIPPPPTPAPGEATAAPSSQQDKVVPLASFSGHIYQDPRVVVATEDARAYVGRFKGKFDVIYSLSSNTFAALASGSFALAESYLFTTEAFADYWNALSPGGFMMMEHQFYVPRLTGSVLDALREAGVADPASHIAVYDLPKMKRNMILLSRRPLTQELRQTAFGALTKERFEEIHLLFPAPAGLEDNLVNRIVTEGWRAAYPTAKIDISPTTDSRPFVGQMGRWKNFSRESLATPKMMEVGGFPVTTVLIVTILAVVLVLLAPACLLPYLTSPVRLRAVPWLYFFTIGAAFMAIEVVLIQKYALLVGPSVLAIATILLTLLAASGLGSRISGRVRDFVPFLGIGAWVLVDAALFPALVELAGTASLPFRVAVTALMVTPLGVFMGMPFPKAGMRVGELVDWGFAVNGTASVLGATGVLLVAFTWGFGAALGLGAALYVVAFALLARRQAWVARPVDAIAPALTGQADPA